MRAAGFGLSVFFHAGDAPFIDDPQGIFGGIKQVLVERDARH
jgi:hypothetical protein